MKKLTCLIALLLVFSLIQITTAQEKELVPGEQAPLANPGQNTFGRMRNAGTTKAKRSPLPARPEPEIKTISLMRCP